jgi:hypothetical protein
MTRIPGQVVTDRDHRGHSLRRPIRSVRPYPLSFGEDLRLRIRRPGVRIPASAQRPFDRARWPDRRLAAHPSATDQPGIHALAVGARSILTPSPNRCAWVAWPDDRLWGPSVVRVGKSRRASMGSILASQAAAARAVLGPVGGPRFDTARGRTGRGCASCAAGWPTNRSDVAAAPGSHRPPRRRDHPRGAFTAQGSSIVIDVGGSPDLGLGMVGIGTPSAYHGDRNPKSGAWNLARSRLRDRMRTR